MTVLSIAMLRRRRVRGLQLPPVLMATWLMQAADPRDKIYGCMGLVKGRSIIEVKPDYSAENTKRKLFTDVTRKLIEADSRVETSMTFLSLAGIGLQQHDRDLPSWVPDYALPASWWFSTHLQAGISATREGYEQPIFQSEDLFLPVYVVDAVHSTSPQVAIQAKPMLDSKSRTDLLRLYLNAAIDMVSKAHPMPLSTALHENICQTLNSFASDRIEANKSIDLCSRHIRRIEDETVIMDADEEVSENLLDAIAGLVRRGLTVGITKKRRLALLPLYSRPNDRVVIVPGAHLPFLLRSTEDLVDGVRVCQLVGYGYIHELNPGLRVAAEEAEGKLVAIAIR